MLSCQRRWCLTGQCPSRRSLLFGMGQHPEGRLPPLVGAHMLPFHRQSTGRVAWTPDAWVYEPPFMHSLAVVVQATPPGLSDTSVVPARLTDGNCTLAQSRWSKHTMEDSRRATSPLRACRHGVPHLDADRPQQPHILETWHARIRCMECSPDHL